MMHGKDANSVVKNSAYTVLVDDESQDFLSDERDSDRSTTAPNSNGSSCFSELHDSEDSVSWAHVSASYLSNPAGLAPELKQGNPGIEQASQEMLSSLSIDHETFVSWVQVSAAYLSNPAGIEQASQEGLSSLPGGGVTHRSHAVTRRSRAVTHQKMLSIDHETLVPLDLFSRWADAGKRARHRHAHVLIEDGRRMRMAHLN